jgi:Dienelactone hydrolase and related enzymes
VDCYGGAVGQPPAGGAPLQASGSRQPGGDLSCPLLGLFGRETRTRHRKRSAELEQALKANGKTYEFHLYDGAGHAFLQVDRPSYRPEAAVEAWQRIWDFYGRYL